MTFLKRLPLAVMVTVVLAGSTAFPTGTLIAQEVVKPRPAPKGAWTVIGTTMANYSVDHDSIIVKGRHDNFRKILIRVEQAPLHMHRLLVTYDNGEPEDIPIRQRFNKGGESREIDLHGDKRSIQRIDFWYDTRGHAHERAEVTVFGRK